MTTSKPSPRTDYRFNLVAFLRGWTPWVALSAVMLINALIARGAFQDGGVNSAICAGVALLMLIPMLLIIVHEDFKHDRVHINELVLIAVVAGITRGDLLTAGFIAFFMLVGLLIETRSASGARESLESLTRMTRTMARQVFPDGTERSVEPDALKPGDLVRIRPGETIPADGRIAAGNSSIQEANITGESLPVDKGVGAEVFAGTVNLSGALDVEVSKTGEDTTLGKVRELILAAEKTRPRFIRMIDAYAKYYTPLILILAFFVWVVNGHRLDPVVAVLVAACPIALVLSTPSAAVAALSAGARLGVLIKNISDIESFSTITAFVFDKTGTLTTGDLAVTELIPAEGVENADLVAAAAAVERHSNHPVAKAVCALCERTNVPVNEAREVRETPGRGVSGVVEGVSVVVGNAAWVEENGLRAEDFSGYSESREEGVSALFVMRDARPLGWIALEDSPRPDASACVERLRAAGVNSLAIVTGDLRNVAAKVAGSLGIKTYWGECKPAEKVEKVRLVKDRGHRVAFVGDGVNDAPALAASDVSVAMGAAGSDLAVETATIALLNNHLDRLPFLFRLARDYKRIMIQNFVLGALFIVCGVSAGAAGYLSAVPAAVLQVASAVIIVMNSARLVRGGE